MAGKRRGLIIGAIAVAVGLLAGTAWWMGRDERPTPDAEPGAEPTDTFDTGGSESPLDVSQTEFDYAWKPVRMGGGGYITGVSAADDGTLVASSDTFGAYIRPAGALSWRQLALTEALPEEFRQPKFGSGGYAVVVAPTDSQRIYFMYNGHVLVSSDGGTTFQNTTFEPTPFDPNSGYDKMFAEKIAVDPSDPDVVLVGTPQFPLQISTDAGQTWADAGTPAGLPSDRLNYYQEMITSPGTTGIAYDRSSPLTDDGRTSVVYAAPWGQGVFRSTDGGVSWTSIGGPTQVAKAAVSGDGKYYALGIADGQPMSIMRYDGTEWATVTPDDARDHQTDDPFLAIRPDDPNTVIVGNSLEMFISRDGAESWQEMSWSDTIGDVTWADHPDDPHYYLVVADLAFDPANSGRLWFTTGEGMQYAQLDATSNDLVWTEATRGIENMVASEVVSPRNSPPVFGVFDFGQFSNSNNLDDFSLQKGPVDYFAGTNSVDASPFADGFIVASTADYIANPEKYELIGNYSDDGGATWKRFESLPTGTESARDFGFGTIAVSTPDNIVWAPGHYVPTQNQSAQPYYTLDRGKTWNPVELPGVTEYPLDSIGGFMFGRNRRALVADKVTEGVFYLQMLNVGTFTTTDGGVTWTKIHEGNFSIGDPYYTTRMATMPGQAGRLFYTDGPAGDSTMIDPIPLIGWPLLMSSDGAKTWTEVPNVAKVLTFGFGAPFPDSEFATIYVVGTVNDDYGIWRSTDDAKSWTKIGTLPVYPDNVVTISGDQNDHTKVYLGYGGSSYVYGTYVGG